MALECQTALRVFIRGCKGLAREASESLVFLRLGAKCLERGLELARGSMRGFWTGVASWGRRARPWVPFIIYNSLLAVLFPLVAGVFFWQVVLLGRCWPGLLQRLGMAPAVARGAKAWEEEKVWFHAVSVGEVIASLPVVKRVYSCTSVPLVASVTTPTGRQVGESRLKGLLAGLFYFPFDFPFPVRSVLDVLRPTCLVLVESEVWPNLIFLAKASGARVAIVNGRISDRTFWVARLFKPIYKWALSNVDALCMQSETDRERAVRLGANPARARVAGNVKFDELDSPAGDRLSRADFGLGAEDLVILAGSTHEGEDEEVLEAYWQVRVHVPEARLMIAPRHLQRVERLEQLILSRGFHCVRRSQLARQGQATLSEGGPIIVVDTMGELACLYSLCSVAFVGGSLVRKGGQNILQPLACGKPVVFGPHTQNFKEISRMAVEAGVGFRVSNVFELANRIVSLWKDQSLMEEVSRRAFEFIDGNKGASGACARAVLERAVAGARR